MDVLFVGAHPDDIELGAGVLAGRLRSAGHRCLLLVLTDEHQRAAVRRDEAISSAKELGFAREDLVFVGLRDGRLRADGSSVAKARAAVQAHRFSPRVVVTHTAADHHNDHYEAHRLTHAAFRSPVLLYYSVHTSWRPEIFAPRLYIDASAEEEARKQAALGRYVTQSQRIGRDSAGSHRQALGSASGFRHPEAFEVELGDAPPGLVGKVMAWSDSTFHRFWFPVVAGDRLNLLYEAYLHTGDRIDWPTVDENAGRDALREAFSAHWIPRSPLHEQYSNGPDARDSLHRGSVVLAGGAVSNPLVRDVYNRLQAVHWIIEYDMPRDEPAYCCTRDRNTILRPEFRGSQLVRDVAVLSKIKNPFSASGYIVHAAGATGYGTRFALEAIADPDSTDLRDILAGNEEFELSFRIGPRDPGPTIVDVWTP